MGLFDVFSKGGKYFGKAIEPRCEYCEFGKRAKDGDKVLCAKKGLVDATYHCPKFIYSPLKRIPVKQMKLVGFLEGDYDERTDDEDENATNKASNPSAHAPALDSYDATQSAPAAEAPKADVAKADAPKPAESTPDTAKVEAPAEDAKATPDAKTAPAETTAADAKPSAPKRAAAAPIDDLAALAAAAEAADAYDPSATVDEPADATPSAPEEATTDADAMASL